MSIWPQAMSYSLPSSDVDLVRPVMACVTSSIDALSDARPALLNIRWQPFQPLLSRTPRLLLARPTDRMTSGANTNPDRHTYGRPGVMRHRPTSRRQEYSAYPPRSVALQPKQRTEPLAHIGHDVGWSLRLEHESPRLPIEVLDVIGEDDP